MPTAPATTTVSSVWVVSAVTLIAPRFETCVLLRVARAPASCVKLFSASDAPMASDPPATVKATLATTTVALIVPLMSASTVSALAPLPLMREPFINAVADEPMTLRASAPPPASDTPPSPTPTAIEAATDTVWMLAWLSALTVIAPALTKLTPSTLACAALATSFCASDAATDRDAVAPSDTATVIATAAIVLSMRATSVATTDTLAARHACAWFTSVMRAVMPVLILLTARAPAPAPDTARLAPSTMGGAYATDTATAPATTTASMLCCSSTLPSALNVALLAFTRTAPAVTVLPSMDATISLTGRSAPSATTWPALFTS